MNERNSTLTTGSFKKPSRLRKFVSIKLFVGLLIFIILGVLVGGLVYLKNRPKPVPVVNCQEDIARLATELEHKSYDSVVGLADVFLRKNCPIDQKVAMSEQKGTAYMYQNKPNEAEIVFKELETLNRGKLSVTAAQSLAAISYKKGDTETAIKYYKALIQATLDTPDTVDDAWIPQYKTIIKKLGGTP